jgi:hypothetical protein
MFVVGPGLGGGVTDLNSRVLLGLAFAFLAADFLDTSAFRFLIAACDALEPGRGHRAVIPRSEIAGTVAPYVFPGCFIHTYRNNMINRFHVQ